jgi:L-threonylcarbamoyladenylate synthase
LEGIARGLFAALRYLDDQGVDAIHVEGILETDDLAATIMNQLRKAAIQICT